MIKLMWSPSDVEILKSNYEYLSNEALAKLLNRSKKSIKNKLNRLNISRAIHTGQFKKGRTPWNQNSKKLKVPLTELKWGILWTKEENMYLWENFIDMSNRKLAFYLKRAKGAVKRQLHILKLCRFESRGPFKKGQTPWNKGIKSKDRTKAIIDQSIIRANLDVTNPSSVFSPLEIELQEAETNVGIISSKPIYIPTNKDKKPSPNIKKLHPVRIDKKTVIYIEDISKAEEKKKEFLKHYTPVK